MKRLFYTAIVLAAILLLSCSEKQKDIGQFVYVNCFNTIHVDKECASKLSDSPKTKEECMANMRGVQFIDTCTIVNNTSRPYKFCPKCVDDNTYKQLSEIIKRNENHISYRHQIYNKLVMNYDMEPFDEFTANISDTEKRMRLYNVIAEEGIDEGTFEEFSS